MIQIQTNRQPGRTTVEVFVYDRHGRDSITFFTPGEDGMVIGHTEKIDFGAVPSNQKPFMIMIEEHYRDFCAAFMEQAKTMGIQSPTETYTKGKLEATEAHLADMRTLVFAPQEIITGEPMKPVIH